MARPLSNRYLEPFGTTQIGDLAPALLSGSHTQHAHRSLSAAHERLHVSKYIPCELLAFIARKLCIKDSCEL